MKNCPSNNTIFFFLWLVMRAEISMVGLGRSTKGQQRKSTPDCLPPTNPDLPNSKFFY